MKISRLLVAGLVLGRYALRGQKTPVVEVTTSSDAQQWEYGFYVTGEADRKTLNEWGESSIDSQTAIQHWINREHASCLEIVNRLGRLGWELTGVNTTQRAPYVIYIFKRMTQPLKIHQYHNGNSPVEERAFMDANHATS